MKIAASTRKGIESLLVDSLKLHEGDKVFILAQTELKVLAAEIQKCSTKRKIDCELRVFNTSEFYNKSYPNSIFTELKASPVDAVILLIEWSSKTTGGRLNFLTDLQNTKNTWRIASMPGITLDLIKNCNCDYTEIIDLSENVFERLKTYNIAQIYTNSPDNQPCLLTVSLGKFTPTISSGVINAGTWGNVPSGEVFCIPSHKFCNGEITLRGSIPNYPLKEDEWVFFRILNGEIIFQEIKASSKKLEQKFKRLFFKDNGEALSKNSNVLAELGVGINKGILNLTGKPLFDEKKLGTLHIGIGSNHQFYGPLICNTHHDLVITDCSLVLSNEDAFLREEVINQGQFIKDRKIKRNADFNMRQQIKVSSSKAYELIDDRIEISYYSSRNGKKTVSIELDKNFPELINLISEEKNTLDIKTSFFKSIFFYRLVLHNIIEFVN